MAISFCEVKCASSLAHSSQLIFVSSQNLKSRQVLTGDRAACRLAKSRNDFVWRVHSSRKCLQVVVPQHMSNRFMPRISLPKITAANYASSSDNHAPSSAGSASTELDLITKGWTDRHGHQSTRLIAQLRNIVVAAHDRSEMHAIMGVQRDNWNKLCLTTVNTAIVAAAMLAAMSGATPVLSLSVTAFLLNAGAGSLMYLANKFQPSQLAEEQRTAARLFKNLAEEIDSTLLVDPSLREDAQIYLENKLERLEALDAGYPLPLTPVVLEKFPKIVKPSILGPQANLPEHEMPANGSNGWSDAVMEDLKGVAEKLRESDIEIYLGWARKREAENLKLVFLGTTFVVTAALLNLATCLPLDLHTSGLAAACSVGAMFCFSFSHGGQIGMIFELYRNCAGVYADMDQTLQKTIRLPVSKREDGELFHQKISLQLGRSNVLPLVRPGEKTAGRLF